MLVFVGKKNGVPEEKLWDQSENQQWTQPKGREKASVLSYSKIGKDLPLASDQTWEFCRLEGVVNIFCGIFVSKFKICEIKTLTSTKLDLSLLLLSEETLLVRTRDSLLKLVQSLLHALRILIDLVPSDTVTVEW